MKPYIYNQYNEVSVNGDKIAKEHWHTPTDKDMDLILNHSENVPDELNMTGSAQLIDGKARIK